MASRETDEELADKLMAEALQRADVTSQQRVSGSSTAKPVAPARGSGDATDESCTTSVASGKKRGAERTERAVNKAAEQYVDGLSGLKTGLLEAFREAANMQANALGTVVDKLLDVIRTQAEENRQLREQLTVSTSMPESSSDSKLPNPNADIIRLVNDNKEEMEDAAIDRQVKALKRKLPADKRDAWSDKELQLAIDYALYGDVIRPVTEAAIEYFKTNPAVADKESATRLVTHIIDKVGEPANRLYTRNPGAFERAADSVEPKEN